MSDVGRVRGIPISPKKFQELRESLGMTQEELAQLTFVASSTIGRIESIRGASIDKSTLRIMAERLTASGKLAITYEQLVLRIGGTGSQFSAHAVDDVDKLSRRWVKTLSDFIMHTPRDVQRKVLGSSNPEELDKLRELLTPPAAPARKRKAAG